MAGHSKWAQIKHKKAVVDSRRGKLFSKLAREIMVAARLGGGDPSANPRLRAAIEKARSFNMPKDNIEKAIKKGTGELEGGASYEELMLEAYAPGGVAVLIEAITDNRNRTTSEIRHIFSRAGGSIAEPGAVAWNFARKGLIIVDKSHSEEEVMEAALEGGAEDIKVESEGYAVITLPEDFSTVKEAIEKAGLIIKEAQVTYIPVNTVPVDETTAEKILRLIETLEEHDDVQNVYTNADIPDEVLEKIAS